jgi:hypothetical protein
MDKHTLALISIVGSCLDVLGALYLAYDLLGGEHGPLRTLTRAVTYGVLFGVGFGLALGPVFGIASGAAHGITLAREFSRRSRSEARPGWGEDVSMSAIRGLGFGIGAGHLFGWPFGIFFGVASAAGQVIAYPFGIRPTLDYGPQARPRITKWQFLSSVNRMVGYSLTCYLGAGLAHQREHALAFALKMGLVIGGVTAAAVTCTPFVEWNADRIPQKRMGVFGIILILAGFSLQSVQYWVALADIPVR